MKTDRELLEAAAKTAGLNVKAERVDADDRFIGLIVGPKHKNLKVDWNPLTDDGDALRLAVRLNIPIIPYDNETSTGTIGVVAKNWGSKEANTRRAIVCAAAAMVAG